MQIGSESSRSQSCCWLLSRYWKLARWTSSAQVIKRCKMGAQRYYLPLICLALVLFSCLLASLVISRSVVEELEASDDSSGSPDNQASVSSSARMFSAPPVELEQRSLDIIDLIESGKTFAFAKYRLQVVVPKSTPLYQQQPAFLQPSGQVGSGEDQQEGASETRYVLTSSKMPQENAGPMAPELGGSNATTTNNINNNSDIGSTNLSQPADSLPSKQANPLEVDIKPVAAHVSSKPNASEEVSPETEVAILLALATADGKGDVSSHEGARSAIPTELDLGDPLEGAASEMHLSLQSLNRTMTDCFVVDTDKRYGQKVAVEDKYRMVANTRKVGFKKMLATIVECRHLTLNSLPDYIKARAVPDDSAKVVSAVATLPPVAEAQVAAQPRELFSNMIANWLQGSVSQNRPRPNDDSSGQERQLQTTGGDSEEGKKQATYLNMGISMVSGIVPNTLWCGLGDRAANYSELGAEYKVDACCRAHDHCPIRLKPFATDYGLVNWSVSTRSHCDCDLDFNDCLNAANSTLSNVIRVLYFRFVGLQCIDVQRQ